MVDPLWEKLCNWARECPLFQREQPRPRCVPIVLAIEESSIMADTFRIKLTFLEEIPTPDPNDPNADKDPIVARRFRCTTTPLAGGEPVVAEKDFPIDAGPNGVFEGVPQQSRVLLESAYVNDDGAVSSAFTAIPEFEVLDGTGPVNVPEGSVSVEIEEE